MSKLNSIKNKLFEKMKEKKKTLLILGAVWLVFIPTSLFLYKDSLGKEFLGNEKYDQQVELFEGEEVVQYFNAEQETESISIKFATYARSNSGKITIKVEDVNSHEIYAEKTKNVKGIQDNQYFVVPLNHSLKNQESCKVTITSTSKEGKGIGVYYSISDFFEEKDLVINQEVTEGDLSLKLIIRNDSLSAFNVKLWIFIILGLILLTLIAVLCEKMEVIFTSMIFVFGLIFMLIIVPGSVPDDIHHYEEALSISSLVCKDEDYQINKGYVNYDSFSSHTNGGVYFQRFIRDINKPLKLRKNSVRLDYASYEPYLGYYIPQAIGVIIARFLGVNMLKIYYAGRLCNLLFYCACIYLAIKKTPIHKVLFGLIASLPLFIQQASSLSYDSFINGLVFIVLAYLLKWKFEEKRIELKEFIFVFIVNLLLTPAKVLYGLFTFLYFFIPSDRFGGKKNKIIGIILLSSYTIYLILYNIYIRVEALIQPLFTVKAFDLLNDTFPKIEEVCEEGKNWKIRYFFTYPKETIFIYLKTIRYNIKKWFFEATGKALSGSTLELPKLIFYPMIGLILASSFRKENKMIPIPMKLSFIFVCVTIAMLVLTTMLTGWLSPYNGMIQGVQGRYFCPLLPYFFLIFGNNKISIPQKWDKYMIYGQLFIMFEVIAYVLGYTFVN